MAGELIVKDKGNLRALLSKPENMQSIRDVLPKHLTPERVCKMALVAVTKQPKLLNCTVTSVMRALMTASELGLDCSGTLGSGYLVPFANECTFMPGYRGLIDLARRSGEVSTIEARVVYKQDVFRVEFGTDPRIIHEPYMAADRKSDKASMVCVYAVAVLTDGTKQSEVMTLADIEAIRNRSRAKDDGPWKTDYAEMARKTVVRRIMKYLPLSSELIGKAIEADDHATGLIDVTFGEPPKEPLREPQAKKQAAPKQLAETPTEDPPTQEPEEEPAKGVDAPTTDPTKGPSEHEKIAIMLAERDDVTLEVAMDRLNTAAKPYGGKSFADLSGQKLQTVIDRVKSGDIKCDAKK